MALILQVIITNDETGEVEKSFVENVDGRTHSWEAAQAVRRFMARVFAIFYGPGCDEW